MTYNCPGIPISVAVVARVPHFVLVPLRAKLTSITPSHSRLATSLDTVEPMLEWIQTEIDHSFNNIFE